MPTPPPDPNGRPSSAKRAPVPGRPLPDESLGESGAEAGANGSTNSHHPAASPSDVLRSGSSDKPAARQSVGSDILQMLNDPGANPNLEAGGNTDDAPTVITRSLGNGPPPPTPLNVLAADPPTLAGRRLGNYELIESVGAGGMAAVLKARDLELGRIVALKILPPAAARDPESVTRFKQEARAAALLDHENVARVYACGEDQGLHFIAFEFVEGINLRQMIDRRGTIPAADSVRYMIQVAAGLAHAAERGVVHRDIKPSNILITPDGRAKIVDMGLARELEASADGGLTQSGVTLGTFDYISPEQALDPRRADVRSDIYSLGCTFYHALTGRPPVPEGTAAKKLHAHQHVDPLDPRQIRGDIPDELVVILARMMAKDQAQRYQSPEELIAHLKALAQRLNISSDAMGHDSVVRAVRAEPSVRPPRLRLGWVLGVTAVAAAVAAFALSTGDPGSPSIPPPWANEPKNAKTDPFQPGNGGTVNPGTPAEDGVVRTAEQFAARIAEANAAADADPKPQGPTKVRLAPEMIDLTKLPEPVVFRGKELELIGSVSPPTILKVNPASASATPPGAFSAIGAESVSISGVRFETAAPGDAEMAVGWAGFVADVGDLTLTDCTFPALPTARAAGVGSVRLTRVGGTLRAERCLFAPAAFGLWVPDACDAIVSDCGFGPHQAAIRIGDSRAGAFVEGPAQDAAVRLERSSFLLDATSAVVANPPGGDPTGVRVTAGYCVFAVVPYTGPIAPLAFLPGISAVRQPVIVRAQTHAGEIPFAGEGDRKNAYHGVAALSVESEGGTKFYTFEDCKGKEFPVADATAVALPRPWARTDPLRVLADRDAPWPAFGLKLTDPAVFTPEDLQVKVIGAQFYNPNLLPKWRAYPELVGTFPPPPKNGSGNGPTQLVWHPLAKDNPLPPNTFTDLEVLLKAARPGAEVLIRHNGVWPLERTIDLEKLRGGIATEFRVTFKPDRGYTPILAPPGDDRLDQTLFRLINGKVAFQGVQFLLKPNRPKDGQTVAAVVVVGGESCVFEDCVFTLAEEDDSTAAAVLVPDPTKVMAMAGGTRPTPQVWFERCVIRGKGRGVWVPASRAVKVDVTQSLTAIDGPLFLAEPGGKPTPGAKSVLRLTRVTAFVGGPVVEMRGGRIGVMGASGLLPLEVHADECLFAAVPGAGRSLVDLDGIDPADAMKTLPWQVTGANRYANFDAGATATPAMIVRPATDGGTPKESNWDQWITFAGEPAAGAGKRLGKVVFENGPSGLAALATLKPADAAVKSADFPDPTGNKLTDAGVTEKLPTPATPEP